MIPFVGSDPQATGYPSASDEWLRVGDAALLLGVSPSTLRRHPHADLLPCHRSPGGHRRYRRRDVEALLCASEAGGPADDVAGSADGHATPDPMRERIEHLERHVRDLTSVMDAGVEINRLLGAGPDAVLREIARRICEISRAPVCDINAVDGDHFRGLVSFDNGTFDAAWENSRHAIEEWPLLATVRTTGKPLVVRDLDEAAAYGPLAVESLVTWGNVASLAVPMLVRGDVVGVIEVLSGSRRDFHREIELVAGLAQVAAAAIDNATLLARSEGQNRYLREIMELGTELSRTRDPEACVRLVARRLVDVLGAAACGIYRISGDRSYSLVCLTRDGVSEAREGRTDDLGGLPATAAAIAGREPLVITDPDDPRLGPEERKPFEDNGYHSEVSVPLFSEDELVGLIDVYDDRRRDFSEHLDFLSGVGQMVAGSLENAFLLREVERHNAIVRELVELGVVASTSDMTQVVRAMVERLMTTIEADSCEIYALDDGVLRLLAGYDREGFSDEWLGWSEPLANYPATAAAVVRREALVVANRDDERLTPFERGKLLEFGLESEICVPLVNGDVVVGIIDMFDTRPRDYSEYADFLQSVAPIIAAALANAMLVERLKESADELRVLVDAGLTFGATLDVNEVLTSIATRMSEISGADWSEIFVLEGSSLRNVVCLEGTAPFDKADPTPMDVNDFYAWRVAIDTGQPVATFDIFNDPNSLPDDIKDAQDWGYRSTLDLPLVVQGKAIGIACLYGNEPGNFAHVELLQGLSAVAAQALANASLFRDLDHSARRMSLVAESSLQFSASLDLEEVLGKIAGTLRAAGGFTDCDVYRLEDDELVCVASLLRDEVPQSWLGAKVPLDDWPAMKSAVDSRSAVAISSIDDPRLGEKERQVWEEWGERSCLSVPLVVKDHVVGVVDLIDSDVERVFAEEEIATVMAISRVAGLAMENADLYHDIQQMHLSNLKALSSALNAKDYYTLGHAARVGAYMVLLGKELGWSRERLQKVEEVAYLHDIGKIGVSDRVLLKPGGLNEREWELMRQHPIFSADIIRPLFADELVQGVRHHHERHDGGGYPDGLTGEAIPEMARAMCVVDSYDAMSFKRPYRQALTFTECCAELRRCRGSQFNPAMADAFIRVLDRLQQRKHEAIDVADDAARRIDPVKHERLQTREDEARPEYREITRVLQAVCDAHPPTCFLGTRALQEGRYVIVADVGTRPELQSHIGDEVFADDELPESFAGVRLDTVTLFVDEFGVWVTGLSAVRGEDGRVIAVVAADMPPPEASEDEMEGLRSEVTQTFAAMLHSAAARFGRAELEAITDGLTGLYNHRYLHERLSEEVERAHQQRRSLALLFCDLDRFKEFNDRYGHSAGDDALRTVARVIESSVRHVDIAARYGGEEFAVILVDTGLQGAMEAAERLREGIRSVGVAVDGGGLTVSVGIATYPDDATAKAELLDKADWAMYVAKRSGGDKVLPFDTGQLRLPT